MIILIKRISIIYFASIIGVPVGITSLIFSLIFSLTTIFLNKICENDKKQKKKHNKIVMLARSKLNNIVALKSQALIDLEISHQKHETIINKENNRQNIVMN